MCASRRYVWACSGVRVSVARSQSLPRGAAVDGRRSARACCGRSKFGSGRLERRRAALKATHLTAFHVRVGQRASADVENSALEGATPRAACWPAQPPPPLAAIVQAIRGALPPPNPRAGQRWLRLALDERYPDEPPKIVDCRPREVRVGRDPGPGLHEPFDRRTARDGAERGHSGPRILDEGPQLNILSAAFSPGAAGQTTQVVDAGGLRSRMGRCQATSGKRRKGGVRIHVHCQATVMGWCGRARRKRPTEGSASAWASGISKQTLRER